MKKIFYILLLGISQLILAQNAEQIINKNIQNTGGLTAWKTLNSVALKGKVILGVNEEYPVQIFQQRPNLKKTVFTIKGKEYTIEGYDGHKGYSMNFATNKLMQVPDYAPESFDTDFIDYDSKGFTAEYIGKEKIGDLDCYKVELTKNVNKTTYYFDVHTSMLIREINKDEVLTYYDYRKVGNILLPFKIESNSLKKEGDYVLIFNKIEINKAFPNNTFKF
ncbi:outer membrane lipoprotein-sorting protein [Elizabethkingia sp. JS20170427COW]|uniref:outer membrane lipoprotein-sorting protein n=1 Tax=Elizabethkingia sp. JS20170427COW TaxID=2583851 RepID=UPI001110CC7E|nr:outer membrane lipoprotein-sorting protein [Elizabethkingia sp. JS20170427COW]QCX52462.1 outer membrane lipoprotein-sorting protein [Elizabethkingia sp. JS20170427COW]